MAKLKEKKPLTEAEVREVSREKSRKYYDRGRDKKRIGAAR